jgi:hypothetical protein
VVLRTRSQENFGGLETCSFAKVTVHALLFGRATRAASKWELHPKVVAAEVKTPLATAAERLSSADGPQHTGRDEFGGEPVDAVILLPDERRRDSDSNPLIPRTYRPGMSLVKRKSLAMRRGFIWMTQLQGATRFRLRNYSLQFTLCANKSTC